MELFPTRPHSPHRHQAGQALIEYLFVIVMLSYIGSKFSGGVGTEMSKQMGKLAHVLSLNLSVGVCSKEAGANGQHCYFSGYKNGFQ